MIHYCLLCKKLFDCECGNCGYPYKAKGDVYCPKHKVIVKIKNTEIRRVYKNGY